MSEQQKSLIGRSGELEQLKQHVFKFAARNAGSTGLQIISVSGSGGVGKTYLLDAVLDETRSALNEALTIKIDASNEHLLKEFVLIVDQMLAPTELPQPAKSKHDYFPASRALFRKQLELAGMVESEISENKDLSEQVKSVAKALYRLSPAVKYIPKYGPAIAGALKGMESVKAEEYVEPALEVLTSLKALSDDGGFFANPLTKRRFTALRHSPYEAIADAYVSDLSAMLEGYRNEDLLTRLTHSPIKGLNRLLLIVDDYEAVGRVIGKFMVESLLPRLKNAAFSSLVIFLGRDSVYEADKDFGHHLAGNIAEPIRLEPFCESEGVKYLTSVGYTEAEALDWYRKARGLPFILRLLAENRTNEEKQSAIFFKRFYERTTRWMSSDQKEWLLPVCYLDNVNEDTLELMLPEVDAGRIMDWFENDASVRDVKAGEYTVTPYIRHMLLEYNRRKVGETTHKDLIEKARSAMQKVHGVVIKSQAEATPPMTFWHRLWRLVSGRKSNSSTQ